MFAPNKLSYLLLSEENESNHFYRRELEKKSLRRGV